MRRNTQNTITDRVLGIRRDRQGIAVVSVARCMSVLLGLLFKHAACHCARMRQAGSAWASAWPTSVRPFGREPVATLTVVRPVPVETVVGGRG